MTAIKNIQYFVHKHYETIKLFLLFILVIFAAANILSLNNAVQDIKRDNAEGRERMQRYIKCVAVTLKQPLAARQAITLDNCNVDSADGAGEQPPSNTPPASHEESNGSVSHQQVVTPQAQAPSASQRQTPTTSAPPDPNTPTSSQGRPGPVRRVVNPLVDPVVQKLESVL